MSRLCDHGNETLNSKMDGKLVDEMGDCELRFFQFLPRTEVQWCHQPFARSTSLNMQMAAVC